MLDEYAEDFGINFSDKIPEDQQRQIKGNPAAYEDVYRQPAESYRPAPARSAPVSTQWQQPYAEPAAELNQENYQRQYLPQNEPPVYRQPESYQRPQTPGYNFNNQPAASMRSKLDGVFKEESKELKELLRAEQGDGCLKKVFFTMLSIAIVVASFWASFMVGKKIFLPESHQEKVELPAFLKQRTEAGFRETINAVKKVTGTDDLFKPVAQPIKQVKAVPPEVADLYAQRGYTPESKPAASVSSRVPVIDVNAVKPQPAVVAAPPVAKRLPALYRVIAGVYPTQAQAADAAANLKADGFENFIYSADGQYRIQIGAFKNKESATKYMDKAKEYGYNAVLVVK